MQDYLTKQTVAGDAKQRANELGTVNSISHALAGQLNLDELINWWRRNVEPV
jgi:hypothetical protein